MFYFVLKIILKLFFGLRAWPAFPGQLMLREVFHACNGQVLNQCFGQGVVKPTMQVSENQSYHSPVLVELPHSRAWGRAILERFALYRQSLVY